MTRAEYLAEAQERALGPVVARGGDRVPDLRQWRRVSSPPGELSEQKWKRLAQLLVAELPAPVGLLGILLARYPGSDRVGPPDEIIGPYPGPLIRAFVRVFEAFDLAVGFSLNAWAEAILQGWSHDEACRWAQSWVAAEAHDPGVRARWEAGAEMVLPYYGI